MKKEQKAYILEKNFLVWKEIIKNTKLPQIGSHSALQILKGAKDEGFYTISICLKEREKLYKSFKVANEIITIKSYAELSSVLDKLTKKNVIFIPHASLITYLGIDCVENFKIQYFGNKKYFKV